MYLALTIILLGAFCFLCLAWYLGRRARNRDRGKDLSSRFKEHMNEPKLITIENVSFKIKKIAVLDYLEGAKVLAEVFSVYQKNFKDGGQQALKGIETGNMNKLKKYITDVICAGCVEPRFVRSEKDMDEGSVLIDDLFTDWILAQSLAQEIFEYTYGKKK